MAGDTNLRACQTILDTKICELLYVPATDKMSAVEVLYQRLGSCQANEGCRHKRAAKTSLWGTAFDIPG